MTRNAELQEIIEAVEPSRLEQALNSRLEHFEQQIADLVLTYEIEESNPFLEGTDRAVTLANIQRGIKIAAWARDEIKTRLSSASAALHGANREVRRNGRKVQAAKDSD